MNDIAAVIGLAQLELLENDNEVRRCLAADYHTLLRGMPEIETPVEPEYTRSVWHNYVVKVPAHLREGLNQFLASKGVSTGVHYEPIHHHEVFKGKCRAEGLEVTEKVWPKLLTLPMFPELTLQDQERIVGLIRTYLDEQL